MIRFDLASERVRLEEVGVAWRMDDPDRPIWPQDRGEVKDQRDKVGYRAGFDDHGEVGIKVFRHICGIMDNV